MAMNIITMEDWLDLHPYGKNTSSDFYYVRLANHLFDLLSGSLLRNEFSQERRKDMALTVTAYFEDVISDIGLWKAFTKRHREMYGKPLPFYEVNEELYVHDEINPQDVSFLIWSIIQNNRKNSFINPDNPLIAAISTLIFNTLDDDFENAPINEYFQDYIYQEELYNDFFSSKLFSQWLFYKSYLLGAASYLLLDKELEPYEDGEYEEEEWYLIEYSVRSSVLFNAKTGPLSLPLKDWLMLILSDTKEFCGYQLTSELESRNIDSYLVESEDDTVFYLHNRKGEKFEVLKSSFNTLPSSVTENKAVVTSLVKYNQEWNVNGVTIWNKEEYFLDFKEKSDAQDTANQLFFERIMKANKGYPLAYFADYDELNQWLSATLGVENRATLENREEEYLVLFATPGKEAEIVPNGALLIKDKRNPYYDKDRVADMGLALLLNPDLVSQEMLNFLITKKLLPSIRVNSLIGKKRGRELVKQNQDFLIRYFHK